MLNKEEYRNRVNTSPLLQLRPEERFQTEERLKLQDDLLKALGFWEQAYNMNITQVERALTGTENEWSTVYDGYAFMIALENALNYYDPEKEASFTTYFMNSCYQQEIKKVAGKAINETSPSLDPPVGFDKNRLKDIKKILRDLEASPEIINDDLAEQIMTSLDIKKRDTLDKYLEFIYYSKVSSIDAPLGDDENGMTLSIILPDLTDNTEAQALERLNSIGILGKFIMLVMDLDEQEYTRTFLTKDFLTPLKKYDSSSLEEKNAHDNYKDDLKEYEESLIAFIFWEKFIRFVMETPPDQLSIEAIDKSENNAEYPIWEWKSIAEFFHVTLPAITDKGKRRDQYYQRMREIKEIIDLEKENV